LALAVLALGPSLSLRASDTFAAGLQAGLNLPQQSDLRLTTGTGPGPTIGAHLEWRFTENHTLRFRCDYGTYSEGKQVYDGPAFHQTLRTKVKDAALGAEALYHPKAMNPPWHLGVGIYLMRWTVATTETISTHDETLPAASTSTWTREGLGLVGGYRLGPHLETELRFIASHYGYENQAVRVASLNLLWHF
jgi:hypothetical protein